MDSCWMKSGPIDLSLVQKLLSLKDPEGSLFIWLLWIPKIIFLLHASYLLEVGHFSGEPGGTTWSRCVAPFSQEEVEKSTEETWRDAPAIISPAVWNSSPLLSWCGHNLCLILQDHHEFHGAVSADSTPMTYGIAIETLTPMMFGYCLTCQSCFDSSLTFGRPRSRKRAFHVNWNAPDVYLALCAGEQEAA